MAKKWYKVLEPSLIDNMPYGVGDFVQYEGEVGPNLEEVSAKEAKAGIKDIQEAEEELTLEGREEEINKREAEVISREKNLTELQVKLDEQQERNDLRSKELDEREANVVKTQTATVPLDSVVQTSVITDTPVQPNVVETKPKK